MIKRTEAAVNAWKWSTAVIRLPSQSMSGWWVGAPSVAYHPSWRFLLAYRLRAGDGRRGYAVRIARSDNGVDYEDLWETQQTEWSTPSFERPCIRCDADTGRIRLDISYVDPTSDQWCIDRLDADTPEGLHVSEARPLFRADHAGLGSVKDPFARRVGSDEYIYVSCTPAFSLTGSMARQIEQSHDPFTVHSVLSMTGVFRSIHGSPYEWLGMVLEPRPGAIDGHTARLTGVLELAPTPVVFYDANDESGDNYEENVELAWMTDPLHIVRSHEKEQGWAALLPSRIRYVDAMTVDDRLYVYSEQSQPAGPHQLLVTVIETGLHFQ